MSGLGDFTFHDLRHCALNNLRLAGNDRYVIKQASGHKTDSAFRCSKHNCEVSSTGSNAPHTDHRNSFPLTFVNNLQSQSIKWGMLKLI